MAKDFWICTSCLSELTEDDFPALMEADSGWSYACPMCGGKVKSYEVPEEDEEEAKQQIRDHTDEESYGP